MLRQLNDAPGGTNPIRHVGGGKALGEPLDRFAGAVDEELFKVPGDV